MDFGSRIPGNQSLKPNSKFKAIGGLFCLKDCTDIQAVSLMISFVRVKRKGAKDMLGLALLT